MKLKFKHGLILLVFFLSSGFTEAQTTVYLKPSEALKIMFQGAEEVTEDTHALTAEQMQKAKQVLGYDLPKNQYSFFVGKTAGKIQAYALIDDQVGKVSPITFITKINPQGEVESVEVMIYRESHGSEVQSRRFLGQFKQKSFNSELRLNKDITNISGATLSSQALVVGVKRALALWKIFYSTS